MFSYKMKVRGKTCLFGGTGITRPVESRMYIVMRIAEGDEAVTIGTSPGKNEADAEIGLLQPGECFAVALHNVRAVWARTTAPLDTMVDCVVMTDR